MKTLKDAKVGDIVTVRRLHGEGPVKRRIMDMGITKGVQLHVRKVAPLGDPMAVSYTHLDVYKRQMYGMRRPTRVRVLSLSLPNSGSMNSASTLSSAMTTPMSVSSTAKVSFKISGIRLSYTCQNAQMDRKARPTRVVRL